MSTIQTVKTQIQTLIDNANATTGNTDTDLTTAVNSLIEKASSGGGSGDLSVLSEELKYFTYQIDSSKNQILLCSILYEELYADTGSYDVVIPGTVGDFSIVIKAT